MRAEESAREVGDRADPSEHQSALAPGCHHAWLVQACEALRRHGIELA